MNSLLIVILSSIAFFWAYRFYAKRISALWQIDPKRATPAFSKCDSVDYIPAKNWLVLFGHHFSSIAGAGPIIGPVIAVALWGWFPALLWVILGTIFIGGVHDFGSLITSVREGGSSIADISQDAVSKRAKVIFSFFVWLALILVIAVFAWLCADTFVKEPKIVVPTLGLIPVAILTGYLLYYARVNSVLATALGLILLVGLMFLGNAFPVANNATFWVIILFFYCYVASVLPVNILLQPRDYLCSFLLFFGVACGFIGLILLRPVIDMPPVNRINTSEGMLWPALFVTVACGAVSGFHSLIASGTSSKQIANERYAKRIGYGGMIVEAMVAVLAIVAVAFLFGRSDAGVVLKIGGPIKVFGAGYGLITKNILGSFGALIAITILNAFILTTLDTATRITRYLSEELFRIKNRYISTFIIVVLGASLALSGKWIKIWPAFGASNQLVAALALFVLSCWLMARKKQAMYTIIPAFFMLLTSIAALITQGFRYFLQKEFLLSLVDAVLIILAGFMVFEITKKISMLRRKAHA